ncbi:hypothetical protein PHLCEN_2v11717 [Hermanssonia centrifuga]|uniref:Elongator complex protein 5 n=1 Tax=Hermanssonia centrifuga TaxID=98765 RepID=A0A2R6NJ40_9APHY|nr:hypothetical protein PHLCEN_2v11717 [Hermanssonia centrifuga]
MTPPPPLTALDKFMGVFIPIAEREYESEKLVFGSNGEGNGGGEIVVEVLTRDSDGSGRRKGVERTLEGWSIARSSCELSDLESLRPLFKRKKGTNMSMHLTDPLSDTPSAISIPTGAILYDPDSADDIDDDDPDEDLDL